MIESKIKKYKDLYILKFKSGKVFMETEDGTFLNFKNVQEMHEKMCDDGLFEFVKSL